MAAEQRRGDGHIARGKSARDGIEQRGPDGGPHRLGSVIRRDRDRDVEHRHLDPRGQPDPDREARQRAGGQPVRQRGRGIAAVDDDPGRHHRCLPARVPGVGDGGIHDAGTAADHRLEIGERHRPPERQGAGGG
jgi:hypothetical protein